MKCFRPLRCWKAPGGGISFSARKGFTDLALQVPCGRCIGCRLENGRQWAARCVHEASLHSENAFLSLTYEDAPLGLVPRDLQLFWKKLRRSLAPGRISYFACGEYGEKNWRPHYHAIVFGYWPKDAQYHKRSGGLPIYRSDSLAKIWGHGHAYVGTVTFESACYVAGYIAKKVTGPDAEHYYQVPSTDSETGEITLVPVEPEFSRSSRNPAVGKRWLEQFGESDAWRHDSVVIRGAVSKIPRYYDKLLARVSTKRELELKKRKRIARGSTTQSRFNNTPERLEAAELTTFQKLKRRE